MRGQIITDQTVTQLVRPQHDGVTPTHLLTLSPNLGHRGEGGGGGEGHRVDEGGVLC